MIFNTRRKMERTKKKHLLSFLPEFLKQLVNMFNEMRAEFVQEYREKKYISKLSFLITKWRSWEDKIDDQEAYERVEILTISG